MGSSSTLTSSVSSSSSSSFALPLPTALPLSVSSLPVWPLRHQHDYFIGFISLVGIAGKRWRPWSHERLDEFSIAIQFSISPRARLWVCLSFLLSFFLFLWHNLSLLIIR